VDQTDTRGSADVGDQAERGQRVDAAEAAQAPNQRREGRLGGERVDLPLERGDPGVDEIERLQVVVERGLPRRLLDVCAASQRRRATPQVVVGRRRSLRKSSFDSRYLAHIRSTRASSPARINSRAAAPACARHPDRS
jgi:hypothetical protein